MRAAGGNGSPGADEARERADRNSESARRYRLAMRAVGGAISLYLSVFAASIVVAVVTRIDGWTATAVGMGLCLPLLIGGFSSYYGLRDQALALDAEGRRLQTDLAHIESKAANLQRIRLLYRSNLPSLIERHRLKARRLNRSYSGLQIVVIAGSLSASTLIVTVGTAPYGSILATANTLLVGLAATFANFFKLKDKSIAAQSTANQMENELQMADLRLEAYSGLSSDKALELLVANTEKIRRELRGRELELDQAPDAVSVDMSASLMDSDKSSS